MVVKTVAIIGGGLSGCSMIKALKEDGLEPVCFEKTGEIGGTWCYRAEAIYGVASTTSTTIINHSKEMGSASDYPYPEDSPNYMNHQHIYEMFLKNVKNFDILRHVVFNKEVTNVMKAIDYEDTGRWLVTVKDTLTLDVECKVFDAVMVCTGYLAHPKMPEIRGMDEFQGRILHSHSLKTFESFTGERVVVVGNGCSALDAAVDISNIARKVYLSVRTPTWIMPRLGSQGIPFDYMILRRHFNWMKNALSRTVLSKMIERVLLDEKFNHKLYGIYPKYAFFNHDPVINDILPIKLISGAVVMKSNVESIGKDNVVFEDGESIPVDTIIMATGYNVNFSFLQDGILINDPPGRYHLYKCMYPPHLTHSTLAFIGFILPFGPGFPLGEMQIRWASFMLRTQSSLPSYEDMMKEIDNRYQQNLKLYPPSDKTSQRVEFINYLDDIASQFGVKPNLWKMFFTDPKLYFACAFGPCVPYQYRLQGPHKWSGARDAVLSAHRRMKRPLRTSSVKHVRRQKFNISTITVLSVLFLCILLCFGVFELKYYVLLTCVPQLIVTNNFLFRHILIVLIFLALF